MDEIIEEMETDEEPQADAIEEDGLFEESPGEEQDSTSSEVEELAMQLGWTKEHEGDDYVDAKTYILKSREIQDSMRDTNKELKGQLAALNSSVDELKAHNERVYKAEVNNLKAELAALKEKRKDAIEMADVEQVEELDEQIADVQANIERPGKDGQPQATGNPDYDDWVKNNQWYLEDQEMARYADAIADQHPGATFNRVSKLVETRVKEMFPDKFPAQKPAERPKSSTSPVEGAGRRGGPRFTKADLTPDQRSVMNSFVKQGIMSEKEYIADIAKLQEG